MQSTSMKCTQNPDNLRKIYFIFEHKNCNKNKFLELYSRYLSIVEKSFSKLGLIQEHQADTSLRYLLIFGI